MKIEITQVLNPTKDSVTIRFTKPKELPSYKAGQHASFRFAIDGEKLVRTYSLQSSPIRDVDMAITIRAIPGGKVSNFLLSNGKRDLDIELLDINGQFFVEPDTSKKRHFIMFAGGSGITPIMSMIRTILQGEKESFISLVYANTAYDRIILYDELREIQAEFSKNIKVLNVISDEMSIPAGINVYYKGRLSQLVAKKTIKRLLQEQGLPAEFYLCGPQGFMDVIVDSLKALQIDQSAVHKEHFFVRDESIEWDWSSLPSRNVSIDWKGQEQIITVSAGVSILEGALRLNVNLPHSCKDGVCGVCRSQLISGDVRLRKNHILSDNELKNGQILLCQGFPMSENIVVKPMLQ